MENSCTVENPLSKSGASFFGKPKRRELFLHSYSLKKIMNAFVSQLKGAESDLLPNEPIVTNGNTRIKVEAKTSTILSDLINFLNDHLLTLNVNKTKCIPFASYKDSLTILELYKWKQLTHQYNSN